MPGEGGQGKRHHVLQLMDVRDDLTYRLSLQWAYLGRYSLCLPIPKPSIFRRPRYTSYTPENSAHQLVRVTIMIIPFFVMARGVQTPVRLEGASHLLY